MVITRILVVLLMAITVVACGKKAEPVKSAEEQKAEKDAATKATRENAVYGEQLKALDKAKETAKAADEAVKKTEEALKKAEEGK